VEHDADSVLASADLGIAVIHGDLERELAKFPDGSFDVVVLSQTLQALDQPARVIHEMLRVGRTGLLSFTNAAHWRRRIALAGGRVTGRGAAGCWNDAPRERALSLRDFLAGCRGRESRWSGWRRCRRVGGGWPAGARIGGPDRPWSACAGRNRLGSSTAPGRIENLALLVRAGFHYNMCHGCWN
jgi:SAM-dependent methyltransferase